MKEKRPGEGQAARRRPSKKRNLVPLYLLLGLIAVLLVVVAAYLPRKNPPPVRLPEMEYGTGPAAKPESPEPGRASEIQEHSSSLQPSAEDRRPVRPTAYRRAAPRGKLIFVIDDVGNNLDELKPFLHFPGPLTLSIMPQRPYTLESYRMILGAGKVPILHQPMQADGNQNPGAGAIYTAMSKGQVDAVLKKNLSGMPEIRWVNNHEGSKATSNIDTMTYVLGYLKSRGIHFLDSRTSPESAVKQAALRLGLPYYKRNSYFLDNEVKSSDIEKEIEFGLNVARKEGYAVMIGHVWDRDLPRLLIDWYPRLVAEGYEFADIRSLPKEVDPNAGAGN